jgi:sodium-dependent dicarboxylate transporter 2/3/5
LLTFIANMQADNNEIRLCFLVQELRKNMLWLGPLTGLMVALLLSTHLASAACITAAVAITCVLWWIFEPVPIPVTSLLPFAVFQLTGVLDKNQVAQSYGSPLILLMLGGFLLSAAMAKSGAHRRIALGMIQLCGGGSSRRLVMGFMLASALLSMWISNTATTLMLLPVALAVLEKAEDAKLAVPLMLGVAYAASIGGIGTPIGTPPNLVFMQVYEEMVGESISFLTWMSWALPIVLLMVPVIGLWLTRGLDFQGRISLPHPGHWRAEERRVLVIFALCALAWVTRQEPFGGWSQWLNLPTANDASVALLAVVALFVTGNGKGDKLLDWQTASGIPWGILLLFGGGICLAKAFVSSGLSAEVGGLLSMMTVWPVLLMMLALCLVVTFLTETTSNTASTVLLMPILAAAALAAQIDPLLLMVPAAISASCAFMLPVATAPNSIVFASGKIATRRMASEGVVLNVLGAVVIAGLCYLQLAQ